MQFLTPSTRNRIQTDEPKVLSADKRILKLWEAKDGTPWTSVEPAVDMNCVAWCRDSGMFLTANEGRQQHAFFIPQLGPAPNWCSFLDNIVEEMADDPNDPHAYSNGQVGEVYDNYKFLTVAQLRTLNLDHLIGKTNLLRPYMHGYFVAQRLYEEARLIANPSSWEDERAKRVKEKIEKERESRIRGKKQSAAKVNRKMASKLLEREEKRERRRAQRVLASGGDEPVEATVSAAEGEEQAKGLLGDSRFARLFQDEDFTIDETSREFQSLNPSSQPVRLSNPEGQKRLTAVEEEMVDDVPGSSSDGGSSDDDDAATHRLGPEGEQMSSANYKRVPRSLKTKTRQVEMRMRASSVRKPQRDLSFRSQALRTSKVKPRATRRAGGGVVGGRVLSFEPQSGKQRHFNKLSSEKNGAGEGGKVKERRSASGNTFRRM